MGQGYMSTSQPMTLNNHQPRCGIAKLKRRRKCHCPSCGGKKQLAVAKVEDVEWKKEITMVDQLYFNDIVKL